MNINIDCLLGAKGILRIITLILGIICICMTALFHLPSACFYQASVQILFETLLLYTVIAAFIISIILITAHLLDGTVAEVAKIVDAGFHIGLGLSLLIGAGLFSLNVDFRNPVNREDVSKVDPRCNYKGRVATVVLGFFDAIVYFIFGIIICCCVPKNNAANPTDEDTKSEINNPSAMEEET